MADPPLNVVTIAPGAVTIVDVFAKQIEMGAQLAVIHEQLKSIPDHEQRIRALERWKYSLPVAILLALTSVCATVWGAVHH